jgi:preprotein translocase subunit SecA
MIKKVLNKLLGDRNKKIIKSLQPTVEEINKLYEEYKGSIKDQNDVLAKTSEFKRRLEDGETLDQILPEAYALVKTACTHLQGISWPVREKEVTWDMIPYDVQLVGGIVLHQGNIAEMKTGEGKTLVSTMPVYLNALTEKGVFVVTVNDYLAQRDAEWMEGLFNYLGLSVGVILHGLSTEQKKAAYSCDITYGTNNEFGFDYLRDNMNPNPEKIVQRNLYFAIIDEVDSILIDEARTPLIISAPAKESTDKYQQYDRLVGQLKEGPDFDIDEKAKTATLTEQGVAKMEELMGIDNIYTDKGFNEVHHIEQALRGRNCYQADTDYIVQDGQIVIIDEFTGRLMKGRRYGHGLHQAIEAKENVEIKRESKTLATVSFQNYFRLFDKLAGMTGTAETEAEEFYQIYGLDTIIIPTNKPIARDDKTDLIYKNQKGKYMSILAKVKELHQKGQPVLLGTISVERSEILDKLLKTEGIPHNVLNAKHHEREAEIVAEAGQKGAVTIATNMAGRGTDIKLGEGVKELGGLYVMSTERHESRRIDNQLRGRSGRQGDPGTSQFYVSMEDDIMRKFGGDRVKGMMDALNFPEEQPIQNKLIARSIESAQKKVEGRNFDIRKHLVEYDDVMNIHRNVVYKMRRKFLDKEDCSEEIKEMIEELAENIVRNHTEARKPQDWNRKEIYEAVNAIHHEDVSNYKLEDIEGIKDQDQLIKKTQDYLMENYSKREKELPEAKIMRRIEKAIYLRANDVLWMEHIDSMTRLRENVAFSGYAQKDPLTEYKSQGYNTFMRMLNMVKSNTVNTLFKIDLEKVVPDQMSQRSETKNMSTNQSQSSASLSGGGTGRRTVSRSTFEQSNDNSNPVVVRVSQAANVIHESDQKVGRNDPCHCGSGKKNKKCCG